MISHKHKFVFTRVTKTASSAIAGCLKVNISDLIQIKGWSDDKHHIPMWYYRKNIPVKKFEFYYKFGFVRNSWDRLISAYHYSKKFGLTKNLKEWVTSINPEWKYDKYGLQYNFVNGCDFIGRFENLQEDFNIICDKIAIPHQKLPHKNATKHKHYTEYYNDETKQIVAEKYAKDIEYFGYKFGE